MYFRVLDDQGTVIDATNNAQSRASVKNALLSHLRPIVCEADFQDLEDETLRDILKSQGYTFEESEQPFTDEYDYDNEIHKEWSEAYGAY